MDVYIATKSMGHKRFVSIGIFKSIEEAKHATERWHAEHVTTDYGLTWYVHKKPPVPRRWLAADAPKITDTYQYEYRIHEVRIDD